MKVGDVVVFEEALGPKSGKPGEADPTHRHAVRLTAAAVSSDKLGGQFATPPNVNPVAITEIEWGSEDALPFPLCISSEVRQGSTETPLEGVSVARGNIVLADNGRTIADEELKAVPQPTLLRIPTAEADRCTPQDPEPVPPRFRPRLKRTLVSRAVPYDPLGDLPAASRTLATSPQDAVPVIGLRIKGQVSSVAWTAVSDLLESTADDPQFVAETESDGTVFLRFGDDRHGMRPPSDTVFLATYRVGNGARGNVASDAIAHIVTSLSSVQGVRNPMPARSGAEPESIEHVRQNAPFAFRSQARAVTAKGLCRRRRAVPRRPESRRHAALDRQLAHRVPHGRPAWRADGRRRIRDWSAPPHRGVPIGRS